VLAKIEEEAEQLLSELVQIIFLVRRDRQRYRCPSSVYQYRLPLFATCSFPLTGLLRA
jgi:hypothetical protein